MACGSSDRTVVGLAAPQPRLLGALVLLGAREQPTGWDTGLREVVIVRAGVERRVFGGLSGDRQIGDQRALDSCRSLRYPRRALIGGRRGGLISVVGEVSRVRRGEHVEVQIQRDVLQPIFVKRLNVLLGTDEPQFLCPPEREPHGILSRRRRAHLQCGLEYRGHPRAVVVDAGALRDAVQVRSYHHHVLRGTGLRLCDHVARLDGFDRRVDLDRRRSQLRSQPRAVGLADADHRNLHVGLRAERAAHALLGDVVGNHQPDCTSLDRHILLCRELAGPAVDQHHGARDREAVIVGGRTAGCVVGARGDQRTAHAFRPGTRRILQHVRGDVCAVDRQRHACPTRIGGSRTPVSAHQSLCRATSLRRNQHWYRSPACRRRGCFRWRRRSAEASPSARTSRRR